MEQKPGPPVETIEMEYPIPSDLPERVRAYLEREHACALVGYDGHPLVYGAFEEERTYRTGDCEVVVIVTRSRRRRPGQRETLRLEFRAEHPCQVSGLTGGLERSFPELAGLQRQTTGLPDGPAIYGQQRPV